MIDKLLNGLVTLGERRGRTVLIVLGVLTVIGGVLASQLPINTSQKALIPETHPVQQDYQRFIDEFGAIDSLVVVLSGEPKNIKAAAELFATEFRKETNWVKSIFYRVDVSFFMSRAPLFVPVEALRDGLEVLTKQRTVLERVARINNMTGILDVIEKSFAKPELEFDPDAVSYILMGVEELFKEWNFWLTDPTHNDVNLIGKALAAGRDATAMARSEGFLLSDDERMLFLFVQPNSSSDDRGYLKPFLGDMRAAADRVFDRYPDLRGEVEVGFTGMPAHVLTEAETVFSDVGNGAIVSVILVVCIILVGFRSLRKVGVAVVPIVVGMVIALGAIQLIVGRLTLISAAFMAVMFGMSIDFCIYIIRRTEEELGHGVSRADAVRTAVVGTGRGVLTGGLTTALAFFAVAMSDFVGFSELGITAGTGVLACLAATFLALPALLLRVKPEPQRPNLESIRAATGTPQWHKGLVVWTAVIVAVTAWGIWSLRDVSFDYNALHLLPRDTESTDLQIRMQEGSPFQSSFVAVTASSLDEIRALVPQLKALPEVARVESLSDMIPEQQTEKLQILARYRPMVQPLNVTYIDDRVQGEDYARRIERITEIFEEAQETVFSAGRSDLVERFEKIQAQLSALKRTFASTESDTIRFRTKSFERNFFAGAKQIVDLVKQWMDTRQIREQQLAPEMLARFRSAQGTYAAMVFPKGSMWDVDVLDRFVSQLKSVTPRITGFPVTHQVYSRMVVRGFVQSMAYGLIIIVILLSLHFRQANAVILSLLPLVLALIWLQLALNLAGIPYNFASLAGIPLLLGYGVAYGVNMVTRWMEDPSTTAFVAAWTTGKGVLFSATTTLAGLFSIIFARHKGVSTFGVVLLIGITFALISATLALPTLIDLIYDTWRKYVHGTSKKD